MQYDTYNNTQRKKYKKIKRDKIILICRQYDCLQRKSKTIIRQTTRTIWVLQLKQKKSEAFLNNKTSEIFPHTTATRTIKYLEINLTKDVCELYGRNYKILIKYKTPE